MIRMARCCNPVPGEDIIGSTTKGRGISVHRKDCDTLKSLPPQERARFIDVSWDTDNAQEKPPSSAEAGRRHRQGSEEHDLQHFEDLRGSGREHFRDSNAKANKDETVCNQSESFDSE